MKNECSCDNVKMIGMSIRFKCDECERIWDFSKDLRDKDFEDYYNLLQNISINNPNIYVCPKCQDLIIGQIKRCVPCDNYCITSLQSFINIKFNK